MMTSRAVSAAAMSIGVLLSGEVFGAEPLRALDGARTLFHDVTVIPMSSPGVLEHHSVLVADGRIERVAPASELDPSDVAPGTRVIDGGGDLWLMPGLCDMHVHLPPYEVSNSIMVAASKRACALLLANGVTTARGMAGHPSQIGLRAEVVEGAVPGPTLHLAGPAIHAGIAKTPDEAAALVRQHKEQGFDLIKSHRVISADVYRAVQTTAKEVGIPVAGHVDNEVGIDVALEFDQQFEHLDAIPAALLGDAEAASTFGQFPPGPVVDAIDMGKMPALAARIAEHGTWCIPTLALFARVLDTRTATAELMALPEMRYIVPGAVGQWAQQRNAMQIPADWGMDYGVRTAAMRGRVTKALSDAGVGLMTGSDSPQAFMVTGFSLHAELRALVDAGLTSWQALQCATVNPARYFQTLPNKGSAAGIAPDFGTIEPGKRADLVLLDADPLADISNTARIRSVMVRGKYLDREALDGMLAEVERSARPPALEEAPEPASAPGS